MSLTEKLTEIKNTENALLKFANRTTGEQDTRLGDAILHLADGFGSGGGSGEEHEFIPHEGWFNDVELVYECADVTNLSADTSFDTTSVSTSAKAISTAQEIKTLNISTTNYSYLIIYDAYVEIKYKQGVSIEKNYPTHWAFHSVTSVYSRAGSNATVSSWVPQNASEAVNYYYGIYRNSSNIPCYSSNTYGLYINVAPAVAFGGNGNSGTMKISTPIIYTRTNAGYAVTDCFANIDSANTNINWKLKVYRCSTDIPARLRKDTVLLMLQQGGLLE